MRTGQFVPVPVVGDRRFTVINTGGSHSCAVTFTGRGFCWGLGINGELGNGTTNFSLKPVLISGGISWNQVRSGGIFSCGVAKDGKAYCWGNNGAGVFGDGTHTSAAVPVPVRAPL